MVSKSKVDGCEYCARSSFSSIAAVRRDRSIMQNGLGTVIWLLLSDDRNAKHRLQGDYVTISPPTRTRPLLETGRATKTLKWRDEWCDAVYYSLGRIDWEPGWRRSTHRAGKPGTIRQSASNEAFCRADQSTEI